jgi:hypothetical protein
MAKAQNAPLGILLTLFSVRLWSWTTERAARRLAILASTLIAAATFFNIVTIPARVQWADAYNHIFLAILPESRNPSADLKAFGLQPALAKYSGTGAWSPGSGFHDMVESGLIGNQVTHAAIVRFYLQHPARIWRHAKTLLPIAFSLRPEWCGNFERTAGRPPGARSAAFTLWSSFHEQVLRRIGKLILILLCLSPAIAATAWIRNAADALQRKTLAAKSAYDRDLRDVVKRVQPDAAFTLGAHNAALVPPLQLTRRDARKFHHLRRCKTLVHCV